MRSLSSIAAALPLLLLVGEARAQRCYFGECASPPAAPAPQPYAPQPYAPQPYAPQPYAPQPYAPQPYAPAPQPAYAPPAYAPQPYAPQPYAPPPGPAQPYAPAPQPAYAPQRPVQISGPTIGDLQRVITQGPNALKTLYSFSDQCTLLAEDGAVRNTIRLDRVRHAAIRLEWGIVSASQEVWKVSLDGPTLVTREWSPHRERETADFWSFYAFNANNIEGTTADARQDAAERLRDAVTELVRRCNRSMGDR